MFHFQVYAHAASNDLKIYEKSIEFESDPDQNPILALSNLLTIQDSIKGYMEIGPEVKRTSCINLEDCDEVCKRGLGMTHSSEHVEKSYAQDYVQVCPYEIKKNDVFRTYIRHTPIFFHKGMLSNGNKILRSYIADISKHTSQIILDLSIYSYEKNKNENLLNLGICKRSASQLNYLKTSAEQYQSHIKTLEKQDSHICFSSAELYTRISDILKTQEQLNHITKDQVDKVKEYAASCKGANGVDGPSPQFDQWMSTVKTGLRKLEEFCAIHQVGKVKNKHIEKELNTVITSRAEYLADLKLFIQNFEQFRLPYNPGEFEAAKADLSDASRRLKACLTRNIVKLAKLELIRLDGNPEKLLA